MITISASALQSFVSDIFAKAGCSTTQSNRIAESLVGANLTGHDSPLIRAFLAEPAAA